MISIGYMKKMTTRPRHGLMDKMAFAKPFGAMLKERRMLKDARYVASLPDGAVHESQGVPYGPIP